MSCNLEPFGVKHKIRKNLLRKTAKKTEKKTFLRSNQTKLLRFGLRHIDSQHFLVKFNFAKKSVTLVFLLLGGLIIRSKFCILMIFLILLTQ